MLTNYIKVAWRNIIRYKGFSMLNIVSLMLGICFALLISLWVRDEMSYNRFHTKINDLYYVRTNISWAGLETSGNTPGPLQPVLKSDVPEVQGAARVSHDWNRLISAGKRSMKGSGFYADEDFLSMFSFPTIYGDASTALVQPNSIVLTKSLAAKLFGPVDPVGQSVEIDQQAVYTVRAVVEDVPHNSELQFTWLAPFQDFQKDREWTKTWGNVSFHTYVELLPGSNLEATNEKIAYLGKAKDKGLQFFLQPLADKYLYAKYDAGEVVGGRIEYVRLFSAIAIFLLVIACINFMNLATARAGRRAKEIGVRKVSGANRTSLIGQFMGEVFILSSLAAVLALALAQTLLNWFNSVLGKNIELPVWSPEFWGSLLLLIVITSFLAGLYPAFILSSLKPASILKGSILKTGDQSALLRKGLVILQFTISAFLIVGTLVIHEQISFVKNKNLGIDRNDLIFSFMEGELETKTELYQKELLKSPYIKSVGFAQDNPINAYGTSGDLVWPGKTEDDVLLVTGLGIDDQLLSTLGIPLVAGRYFSKEIAADTSNYIVNETLVKKLGLEDPIDTEISFWNGKGRIVGVVADYHMRSLHDKIGPMVMTYDDYYPWFAWIKPVAGETEAAITHMKEVSKKLNPNYPFEYTFADETFAQQYRNETLTGQLANAFGLVAILISCLGLLGLAAYAAERRRKEIGIRKVLGASIKNIMQLLSKEFVYLILISLIIALPLGWYFMEIWLGNFAYRIDFQWWYLLIAASIAAGIAALPICFQGFKAALVDPVESIKNQ